MVRPVLLGNGDVLAPQRGEDGIWHMERVAVGEPYHFGWVEKVQKQHRTDRGGTALAVFVGGLLAFFGVWGLAQINPDHLAVPVKFFVSQDSINQASPDTTPSSSGLYDADGICVGSSDATASDYDPDC
jgi:hypothetical protein